LTFAKIASALSHKLFDIDIYVDDDLVAVARDILLHYHGVRTGRHGRAGNNSDRLAIRNAKS